MADLPTDKELAFSVFVQKAREILELTEFDSVAEARECERSVADHIFALIFALDLKIPIKMDRPSRPSDTEFADWFKWFLRDAHHYAVRARVAHQLGKPKDIVGAISFSPDYQEEIGQLLNRIRKIVNQADLSDNKKNVIFKRISSLQLEVDRSTTRFDAFLSRWLDLTNAIGEGAENLEPAAKLMERILRVLGRAKADHDQLQLPPPKKAAASSRRGRSCAQRTG
jgi:hypothetical protein